MGLVRGKAEGGACDPRAAWGLWLWGFEFSRQERHVRDCQEGIVDSLVAVGANLFVERHGRSALHADMQRRLFCPGTAKNCDGRLGQSYWNHEQGCISRS
jgi:hypothetical protein